VIPEIPQLRCLVLASRQNYHTQVSEWLGLSDRVGSVTSVWDETALSSHLENTICHMTVIVVDDRAQRLPACLQSEPDACVLVITTTRKTGKPAHWHNQGASDVASIQKPAKAEYAIARLIEQCVMRLSQRYLATRARELEQKVSDLTMVLQAHQQSTADGFVEQASESLSPLDETTRLGVLGRDSANQSVASEVRDLVATQTVLPSREAVLRRLHHLLDNDAQKGRICAMLICVQSNVWQQKSTMARVARLLLDHSSSSTIIGCIGKNQLLLIQSGEDQLVSRQTAKQIRLKLLEQNNTDEDSIGIRIHTLNLPANTNMGADELIDRLQLRAFA